LRNTIHFILRGNLTYEYKSKKFQDDFENIFIYTMSNSRGMSAKITNLGGIVLSLCVPDKNGKLDDVVLGYDNVQSYLKPKGPYFGAIIGRFANRIEDACLN
jgi:aldose 1-epimerase